MANPAKSRLLQETETLSIVVGLLVGVGIIFAILIVCWCQGCYCFTTGDGDEEVVIEVEEYGNKDADFVDSFTDDAGVGLYADFWPNF